ncbi:MAG: hypothetical protein IJY25_00705 [Bacilli bacterium]|nr:hypothetical protein [Bacilli bacterium]
MRELSNKELLSIDGGANWFTAAFFNAASRALSTIVDIGRSLGSSIRRMINGSYCSI